LYLQQQMVMVAHEAVVVDLDTVALGVGTHQIFEVIVIFSFEEDRSLLYASIDDMVIAWDFYTGFSGHGCFPIVDRRLCKYGIGEFILLLSPDPFHPAVCVGCLDAFAAWFGDLGNAALFVVGVVDGGGFYVGVVESWIVRHGLF